MQKKMINKLILSVFLSLSIILAGCIAKERLADRSLTPSVGLEKFATSVRKVDGQAESHYKMALYFQKNRRHKLAIEELKRALELNPGMARAHNAMGVSYDKVRQYDKAVRCYFEAIKIDPEQAYLHNNLGYSQLLRGDTEKAVKAFKYAIRLDGENKRYHNNLALAYVMDDQYELAAEQFRIVDNKGDAKARMAKLLNGLGKEYSNPDLEKLFEDKKDTRVAVAENEPSTTVVAKKDIVPVSSQVRPEPPVTAKKEASDEKSVEDKPAITASPLIVNIPRLEEESEDGESMMTAVVVDTEDTPDRNSSTIKWVPWQEGEVEKADNSSSEFSASSKSDLATQPLHVSAVQIAAGKIAEPIEEVPHKLAVTENQSSTNHVITKPPTAPRPKIIEVARIEAPSPLVKEPYTVEPVTAVVYVRAASAPGSVRVVTPISDIESASRTAQPVVKVIEVAAAESQQSNSTLAHAEPKLSLEDVEVELEIANGNGVNGMARKVAKYLEIRGFNVAEIKNAHSMDHLHTKVLFSSGGKRDLDRLLSELTVIKDAGNLIELEDLGRRIRVVVGKDMLPIEAKLASGASN